MRRVAVVGLFVALAGSAGTALAEKKYPPPAPPKVAVVPKIDLAAARADLFGPDDARALAAIDRLRQARQPGVTDLLLDALAMGVPPVLGTAILDALVEHREPAALETLLHYAQHRDPEIRSRAVFVLGGIDDPRAHAALLHAFADPDPLVRTAAGRVAGQTRELSALKPLLALLKKGDTTAVAPLAALATPDVTRQVAELIGEAPDALIAQCLGAMLLRRDLGPDTAYVEIVRTLGHVPGNDAVVALTAYIGSVPETSTAPSRKEAQAIYEQRLGGGGR